MNFPEFTEEQIEELKKNQYVYKVTKTHLFFTAEFKALAYEKLQSGAEMADILTGCGFDIDVLTRERIRAIPPRLKKEYVKNGGRFNQGKGPTIYDQTIANLTYEERQKRRKKVDISTTRAYDSVHYEYYHLRLPVGMKKKIAETAKKQGVSLNAYIFTAICDSLGIPVPDMSKPYTEE